MASKLHNTEVKVEILKTKQECDHVQFLITETSNTGRVSAPEIPEIETLSLGKLFTVRTSDTRIISKRPS